MYPIALDLTKISILLVGKGDALAKRKTQLEEAGATHLSCHSRDLSSEALAKAESGNPSVFLEGLDARLRGHDINVVMVAGLDHSESETIAKAARAAGKLVNVEDVPELCDFIFTAHIRRGDLLIAVSTGGASPTLAGRVRDYIAGRFQAEWAGFTEETRKHRLALRAEGKNMKEVMAESKAWIEQKGWLDCTRCRKDAA
ncbi:MAG: NAD(P)-dependent oxidoreductase [Alphaproteobacteria bacterium]|nr:NAD(P)-dependent oxidoreductase [Alphaproteobacteria bacterium]